MAVSEINTVESGKNWAVYSITHPNFSENNL